MRCSKCGTNNPSTNNFCAKCGHALARYCAKCKAENPPTSDFCGKCGASLGEPAPPAAAPPDLMRGASRHAPAAERRQLTVLFCDLVGSTQLSQQLDAEEWREIIKQYQQATSGAVARFGGHVAKNLGDGLLIYFGWPTAHEDDPERAIRAGLAIIDAMAPLNAEFAARDGLHLAVRVGMHTGPVVIADGGEVFADTANLAARVQAAAEADTVVVTAAMQRLAAGIFVVDDLGPQELKGVREPITLYRVVRPSGVRSRLDIAAGRFTPFIGREVELAILAERWERVQNGDGQNVLIVGEVGVGKSRSPISFATASPPCRIHGWSVAPPRTPRVARSIRSSRWCRRGWRSLPKTRRPRSLASCQPDSARSPQTRLSACWRTFSVCRHPRRSR